MASIPKVSSWSNVADRTPAIPSAFQASGMSTREGKKDLSFLFKDAFLNGPYSHIKEAGGNVLFYLGTLSVPIK